MLWIMAASANPGPFAGTWVVADQAQTAKAIETVVEDGAQRFNFAIRPIARGKIRKACALDHTITISGDPGKVTLDYKGDNARVAGGPSDGTLVKIGESDVSYKVSGTTLTVTGKNEDGGKVSVYKVDGEKLSATHTLRSSSLGDPPLSWTVHYKKQ